ncbi:MAG: radical SAM protein [Candidatus Thiodiazotropha sp.]
MPGINPQLFDIDSATELSLPPNQLYRAWLETTTKCNLKCRHCYANSSNDISQATLTSDQWKSIIDKILEYGCEHINFIGGEPLYYEDIGGEPLYYEELLRELISYIRSNYSQQNIGVFSNLSVTPMSCADIEYYRANNIGFGTSLYGITAEDHDRFTQKRGSHEILVGNIKALTTNGIHVYINHTILELTTDLLARAKQKYKKLGVFDYEITYPSSVGRGRHLEVRLKEDTDQPPPSVKIIPHTYYTSTRFNSCFYDHIAVNPAGWVMPCIMARKNTINLLDSGLREYFNSNEYRSMSELSMLEVDGCKDCEFKYACKDCRVKVNSSGGGWKGKPNCGYDPRI